jgi:hypothetical protein
VSTINVASPAHHRVLRPSPCLAELGESGTRLGQNERVDLIPDIDYASVAAAVLARPDGREELGEHLSAAWAAAYRSHAEDHGKLPRLDH